MRYVCDNFVYGREFLGDGDLNAQALLWLDATANTRCHGTTHEVPHERFERDERAALQLLPTGQYRPLAMPPECLGSHSWWARTRTYESHHALVPRADPRSSSLTSKCPVPLRRWTRSSARSTAGVSIALVAIERLLGPQITLRNNRRLQNAMRSSWLKRVPHRPLSRALWPTAGSRSSGAPRRRTPLAVKTLADFGFTFQPSLKREQIDSLHTLGFVEGRENVILLGPSSIGKSHLAMSLAIAAVQHGRRVYGNSIRK